MKQRERTLSAVQIRAVEGNERLFELSFSSNERIGMWFGDEILDHSEGAVNLERLNEIGCVLFNHKRDVVVGRIVKAWVESGRGYAQIEFDEDEDSARYMAKVKSGSLRGVSVSYIVNVEEEVRDGATSTDGIKGPCRVARKWTPLEISIVSVPADATVGVGREFESGNPLGLYERQIQINQNRRKNINDT